jgi:hypothetical protein
MTPPYLAAELGPAPEVFALLPAPLPMELADAYGLLSTDKLRPETDLPPMHVDYAPLAGDSIVIDDGPEKGHRTIADVHYRIAAGEIDPARSYGTRRYSNQEIITSAGEAVKLHLPSDRHPQLNEVQLKQVDGALNILRSFAVERQYAPQITATMNSIAEVAWHGGRYGWAEKILNESIAIADFHAISKDEQSDILAGRAVHAHAVRAFVRSMMGNNYGAEEDLQRISGHLELTIIRDEPATETLKRTRPDLKPYQDKGHAMQLAAIQQDVEFIQSATYAAKAYAIGGNLAWAGKLVTSAMSIMERETSVFASVPSSTRVTLRRLHSQIEPYIIPNAAAAEEEVLTEDAPRRRGRALMQLAGVLPDGLLERMDTRAKDHPRLHKIFGGLVATLGRDRRIQDGWQKDTVAEDAATPPAE